MGGRITPVGTIRGPLRPVETSSFPQAVITPDGKTIYVLTYPRVTPVSTATGLPGRPIPVGIRPRNIVFTPDSRTAYVVNQGSGTVTPINMATNKAGKPIKVGFGPLSLAITPNGKTV